jgi:hypothetical protein
LKTDIPLKIFPEGPLRAGTAGPAGLEPGQNLPGFFKKVKGVFKVWGTGMKASF